MGATSYLMSLVWASSLVVGVVLALQGQQMIPSYFIDEKTLFPVWPVTDPGAALRLFFATMLVVLMPKFLGVALEIKRARHARESLGATRALLGVVTETLFSVLLSPILMVTQTAAVFQVLFGLDSGWRTQSRDGAGIRFMDALRYHRWHILVGVLMAVASAVEGVEPWRAAELETALKQVTESLGLKPRQAFQPIRVAITGSTISPGLFESIEFLGREESLERLRSARAASA